MTEAQQIAAGKRWIGEAFERLCRACLGTVSLVSWEWQDEDPEYRIRCQFVGHAAIVAAGRSAYATRNAGNVSSMVGMCGVSLAARGSSLWGRLVSEWCAFFGQE